MKKVLSIFLCVSFLCGCSKSEEHFDLSAKEIKQYLEEEEFTFGVSDYTKTHYVTANNMKNGKKDYISLQKIDNEYIGIFYTFSKRDVNEEHAYIVVDEKHINDSKERKEQYRAFQRWLDEVGLTEKQIREVLDYCDVVYSF